MCWCFTWNSAQHCTGQMNSEETLETTALLCQPVQWHFKFLLQNFEDEHSKDSRDPGLYTAASNHTVEMSACVSASPFPVNEFICLDKWQPSADPLRKITAWCFLIFWGVFAWGADSRSQWASMAFSTPQKCDLTGVPVLCFSQSETTSYITKTKTEKQEVL